MAKLVHGTDVFGAKHYRETVHMENGVPVRSLYVHLQENPQANPPILEQVQVLFNPTSPIEIQTEDGMVLKTIPYPLQEAISELATVEGREVVFIMLRFQ